jgi:hypothetical protein
VLKVVPGYESSTWYGIPEIIDKLNSAINMAHVQANFHGPGASVSGGSPSDFGKLIAEETTNGLK